MSIKYDINGDVKKTVQRLQKLKDRIISVYNVTLLFHDEDDDMDIYSDEPISQVINGLNKLLHSGRSEFFPVDAHRWIESLLCRLNRTLDGLPKKIVRKYDSDHEDDDSLRSLLSIPWKLYLDEVELIDDYFEAEFDVDDTPGWERFERVEKFENELNRRKEELQSGYQEGQRKTIHELCKDYHIFLADYLADCISSHCYISISNLKIQDLNHLLKNNNNSTFHTGSENLKVPLYLYNYQISQMLLQNNNRDPFIPSQNNTFITPVEWNKRQCTDIKSLLEMYRWSLIIGDPGCGKTTLLKTILLQYARSLLQEHRMWISSVKLDKWQKVAIRFHQNKRIADVPTRLPILIRIGDLVAWINVHPSLTMLDYIESQEKIYKKSKSSVSVLRQFIYHGHALLLFDGLDEVSNYNERRKVVDFIDKFMEKYIRTPANISTNDDEMIINEWGGLPSQCPRLVGGNQIILTSRIIGYYLCPLKAKLLTMFQQEPLNDNVSIAYIDHWLLHVRYSIAQLSVQFAVVDNQKMKITEDKVKQNLLHVDKTFLCHPMMLSLVLPMLYRIKDHEEIDNRLTTRAAIYEETVKFALDSTRPSLKTGLTAGRIDWILRNMAVHLHLNSPSGLMDSFDLGRLALVSLTDIYKHESIPISKSSLKNQAEEFLSLVTNNVGFVAARGLDAYGFAHRTFQEYFFAMKIVKSYDMNCCSPDVLTNRVFVLLMKNKFREPLKLLMDWIASTWKESDLEAFYLELSKQCIGPIPIGALFLVDTFSNTSTKPPLAILQQLWTHLIFSSNMYGSLFMVYVWDGLSHAQNEAIVFIEELLNSIMENFETLCRFFVLSVQKDRHETFYIPSWLTVNILEKLDSWPNKNASVETMLDFTFRRIICDPGTSIKNSRLSHILIDHNIDFSHVHPAVLATIVALCGGLYHDRGELSVINWDEDSSSIRKPMFIQFSTAQLHRSTPLLDIFCEYFREKSVTVSSEKGVDWLIEQCLMIIQTASLDDISTRVVHAFVSLLCLQGLNNPAAYECWLRHRAFSQALFRLKLAVQYMRQFYIDSFFNDFLKRNTTLSVCSEDTKILASQILEKHFRTMSEKSMRFDLVSAIVAVHRALSHLFAPPLSTSTTLSEASTLSISLSNNETMLRKNPAFSSHLLSVLLNLSPGSLEHNRTEAIKWQQNQHPYQLYSKNPLFLAAFTAPNIRPLFERLLVTQRIVRINQISSSVTRTVSYVVLLTDILLYIDQVLKASFRFVKEPIRLLLLLETLVNDVFECNLENYAQVILHQISTDRTELYRNYGLNNQEQANAFSQIYQCVQIAFDTRKTHSSIDENEKKTDWILFSESVTLARTRSFIGNENEFVQSIIETGKAIQDPFLRVLCFRYLREIARSWVDTKYYYSFKKEVLLVLEQLPANLDLLLSALVLTACAEDGEEQMFTSNQLFISVSNNLATVPKDCEEAHDQEAVFKSLQRTFGTNSENNLPHSFLSRPNLSEILEMHSTAFNQLFQSIEPSDDFSNLILAQMYLMEVAVDAQKLNASSNKTIHPSSARGISHYFSPEYFGIFKHRHTILIDRLLKQAKLSDNNSTTISFDEFYTCVDFEDRDRPMIESWLSYHNEEYGCQFAALAVFLLVRSQKEMTPTIRSKVEMIISKGLTSRIDTFRRTIRAGFVKHHLMPNIDQYLSWSASIRCLLTNLKIRSLGGLSIPYVINTVDDMKRIFEEEDERCLISSEPFSSLTIIDGYHYNDIVIYIENFVHELARSSKDMLLTSVLVHVMRKFQENQVSDKLLEWLKNLLHCENLTNAQQGAIFMLANYERGRTILFDTIAMYCEQCESLPQESLQTISENVLYTCLLALKRSKENQILMENKNSLVYYCSVLFATGTSLKIQHHALACYISYQTSEQSGNQHWLGGRKVSLPDLYCAHLINTSSYLEETLEEENWLRIEMTVKLIHQHHEALFGTFVNDLCSHIAERSKMFQIIPQPNILAVALKFVHENADDFVQAIRAIPSFNEDHFKVELYLLYQRGTLAQRQMCIELYASFGVVTFHFIEMTFSIILEDFSVLKSDAFGCFKTPSEISRDVLESIMSYLESSSSRQRHLAIQWLLQFVHRDILSAAEIESWIRKDPENFKSDKNIVDFCHSSCLSSPIAQMLPLTTPDEIDLAFDEMLQSPLLTIDLN